MLFDYRRVPVFIVCRDKVSPLLSLVNWLEGHGYENIVLVDNASTYPPLLEYFRRTPHEVVRLAENLGPQQSIWSTGVRDRYARRSHFVVTDCDVIPDSACPGDAVDYFHWALSRYPSFVKAGFGLRIDDLPESNELAETVVRWEHAFWTRRFARNLYEADIDTTFALYRPDSEFALGPAIRTGKPYLARHQPWYVDSRNRSEEDVYYREHGDRLFAHWDLEGHPVPAKKRLRSIVKGNLKWRIHVAVGLEKERTVPKRYRPTVR